MQILSKTLQPFKFRLAIMGLLCGATLASLILFRVRMEMSGSVHFAFLIWNIFLAWIPLGIAYTVSVFAHNRRFLFITIPFSAILWLIFFPNAPYIMTDLLHLGRMGPDVPVWFRRAHQPRHLYWPIPALEFVGSVHPAT
jgi:hypothetical protein